MVIHGKFVVFAQLLQKKSCLKFIANLLFNISLSVCDFPTAFLLGTPPKSLSSSMTVVLKY